MYLGGSTSWSLSSSVDKKKVGWKMTGDKISRLFRDKCVYIQRKLRISALDYAQ